MVHSEKKDEMSTIDKNVNIESDYNISCPTVIENNVTSITINNGDPKPVSAIAVTSEMVPEIREKVFREKSSELDEKTNVNQNNAY